MNQKTIFRSTNKTPGLILFFFLIFSLFRPYSVRANHGETPEPSPEDRSAYALAVFETKPVWRALMLVYHNTDVDYKDSDGVQRHLTTSMPEAEMQKALWSFRRAASIAHNLSGGEAIIDYDVIHVTRPITSITSLGSSGYWVSPTDTQTELDLYAPPGRYDSIFVHWVKCDTSNTQCVPSFGWGWGMEASSWSNGATYATATEAPDYLWEVPTVGEIWLHEWLHGVCPFYRGQGYQMPDGDADGGGSHGYTWSSETGWGEYYRDLMTGRVVEDGAYTGISPAAWQSGSIVDYRPKSYADYYDADSLANYEKTGAVTWRGDDEDVSLGTPSPFDNRMYLNIRPGSSFEVKGRVYIPASNTGPFDSVSIAISNDQVEYWATLAYGNNLFEKNNIAIMRNEVWGLLHPVNLDPGWYTVKVSVDTQSRQMKMKTWRDGSNEPGWQASRSIDAGWVPTRIGFRHYGQGTLVDDLTVFSSALFADVNDSHWAGPYIERLYGAGITGGCSTNPLSYCPETQVTRAQMAVFLEKGIQGPSFSPPNASPSFSDSAGHWAEDWIEALRSDGITGGCGPNLYCPDAAVTRAQMAVFLLKAKYGSSYTPPALGAGSGFNDVPSTHWAVRWIKQLAAEGITGGCGAGVYCPDTPVTRAQMAVFLVKTFNLP